MDNGIIVKNMNKEALSLLLKWLQQLGSSIDASCSLLSMILMAAVENSLLRACSVLCVCVKGDKYREDCDLMRFTAHFSMYLRDVLI